MPLLLPIVLGVLGIGVSLLPPADVQPVEREGERSGSWFAMGLAAAVVLMVCAVAVHRLAQDDSHRDAVAARAHR
jgi:hypothetical protein